MIDVDPTDRRDGHGDIASELLASLGAAGDRSAALALHSVIVSADDVGRASFDDVARRYRDDHLAAVRHDGGDADQESGRLSLDEVREHLRASVLPRLEGVRLVTLTREADHTVERVDVDGRVWARIREHRTKIAARLLATGEHHVPRQPDERASTPARATDTHDGGSVLEARGLVKIYRRRHVVDDVALRLQQGEIVGLLGPNGAGKTTTFYMIVGLIAPNAGRILLDGEDITEHADVPARAARDRLSVAGAVDLPEALGRGQHPRDPRDAADLAAGARRATRDAARRAEASSTCATARRISSRAASAAGSRSPARS